MRASIAQRTGARLLDFVAVAPETLEHLPEFARHPAQVFIEPALGELLDALAACGSHLLPDRFESAGRKTAGLLQFGQQEGKHIELTHLPEAPGQFPQLAGEPMRDARLQLKDRHHFAQPPGGDAGLVNGADIALFDAGKHPCKAAQARFEEHVSGAER